MKTCTKCSQNKSEDEFYYKCKTTGNRHAHCKKCHWQYFQKKCHDKLMSDVEYKIKKQEYQKKYQRIRKLKNYNLTQEDYNKLLIAQQFKCKICGCEENINKEPFDIDHCHSTGKVRGLLCRKCNAGLGLLGDTKETLIKAIKYIEEHLTGNI